MGKAMLLFLLVLFLGAWLILKPGIFFIAPSSYDTDGVTLIYYEKPSTMPVFSSPESLCMQNYGGVNSSCLEAGYDAAAAFTQRLIVQLPYAEWAYRFFMPQR